MLPPPYSPWGISPWKARYSNGGAAVGAGLVGQPLRPRPAHQHPAPLEAHVVVQPPGVVLLDDEAAPGVGVGDVTGSAVAERLGSPIRVPFRPIRVGLAPSPAPPPAPG